MGRAEFVAIPSGTKAPAHLACTKTPSEQIADRLHMGSAGSSSRPEFTSFLFHQDNGAFHTWKTLLEKGQLDEFLELHFFLDF